METQENSPNIYSPNLSDYIIELDENPNLLKCTLKYNGFMWIGKIKNSDLSCQLINLVKLANIIKLNSHSIDKHYSIWLELEINNNANSKMLKLNIQYSNEFIEWEEKIIFEQLNTLENSLKNSFDLIISNQQKQIDKLSNLIEQLQNKINNLEQSNQYFITWHYELHISVYYDCYSSRDNNLIYIPKNIDCVVIKFKSNMYSQTQFQIAIELELIVGEKLRFDMNCYTFNGHIGLDEYSFDLQQRTNEFLEFIKFKKIIINCEGTLYNNSVKLSIVNFINSKIIKFNPDAIIELGDFTLEKYFNK